MTLLSRILIVLTLALLGMQGASACEHEHASQPPRTMHSHESMRVVAMHCDVSMDTRDAGSPCSHSHSLCCMTMCGVHCSAMLSGAGVPARMSSADVPVPRSDPACAGVTRAPPVRPPIV
ncbi:hypothetical protein [Paraburkholderia diazotrophica]|uniref:Uncharacterized protein n=1 Tax=Paraburkholderia diazotrophica TaxID=667676 RepID=A0A1H6XRE1_9BURK|nr:hypothetical protein [Paraburkholderia diazotrophica]SEJ27430.1 hypothetical protein SAMN05192539_1008189 [Paraburkholderia diazotrophica]